ncbi:MAG TPA: FAD-binding oxidoreductase [Mycobacteriales bacterium]|nr:FAD-binding oxidoreductase [Mycobacteriales bacterium]
MRSTVAVVGCGPIGAATAYGLSQAGVGGVTLVTGDGGTATYRNSGGAVCWHRNDAEKTAMIKATADFVRLRVAAGARIRYREQPYLFLDEGVLVPALNLAAGDLVADLAGLAAQAGVTGADLGRVTGIEPVDGGHRVVGDRGVLEARVVVLALGIGNADLVDVPYGREKRQLFVLDLPVDGDRARLPHLVAPIGDGYAYVFVKPIEDRLRLVLGQEDLVADEDLSGPVDHLAALLDAGVADRFPFLRRAGTEQVLWGVDWRDKLPRITEHRPGLFSVGCGSAVRACVPIGARAAAAVAAVLAA